MTLEELITEIEENHLESALEKLSKNPKDIFSVYVNIKEYQRAKLMRANFVPEEDNEEKSIKIIIEK